MQFFLRRGRIRRKRKRKGTILSLEDQQTRNTFFTPKKRTEKKGNIFFLTLLFVKKGEYVKGENKKGEKNDDQTKQSFQKKKKRSIKRDQQRTTFKNENKKRKNVYLKTLENKNKKRKNRKKKDKHAKTNKYEIVPNKKGK